MTKDEFRQAISEHIKKHGSIEQVAGMLVYCLAYVESSERRKDGIGWETKLLGIEAKWKGRIDNELIDASITNKKILMEWLKFFSKMWYFIPFVLLNKKHLLDSLYRIFVCETFRKVKKKMKYADFSPCCGELLKCGLKITKNEQEQELIYWAMFDVEHDNCYRLLIQDIFGILNIERLKSQPLKEILRVINTTIKRNWRIGNKWTILWTAVKMLAFIPKYRKKIVNFLLDLDMSKVRMDEDDRYWTLRYDVYDFGGRTFNDRFAEVKEIDKKLGNFIMCD